MRLAHALLPISVVANLRGGGGAKKPRVEFESSTDHLLSEPELSGIDFTLDLTPEASTYLDLNDEQYDALLQYVESAGNGVGDGDPKTCPFDYEGEIDPFHDNVAFAASQASRKLQDDHNHPPSNHAHMNFVRSSCNDALAGASCVDWSSYFSDEDLASEVEIPCGECVMLDASPGQPLAGSVLNFAEGLNIVGKLIIPSDADVHIYTRYVYVQGEFEVPEPAAGTPVVNGNEIRFTLYGTDELTFTASTMSDNHHLGSKDVGAKAFVIAGGKVDIHAIDSTCPTWTKLQSIEYGSPLPNVALGKPATQSSTYNNKASDTADKVVDGIETTFSHTNCNKGFAQWWEVDLEDDYTITGMKIVNRLDCCGGRLHDFNIYFMDEDKNVVDSIFNNGGIGSRKTYQVDEVNASYVKIDLPDGDCLQLGEVEVYGYLATEAFPVESMDVLTVGTDAARCWSTVGNRIMLTSDTYDWDDSHVVKVASTSLQDGKVHVMPLAKKKTAVDETFGYPDFAVEVALLDRSLVIEGEKDEGEFSTLGGHVIVLHTPHVHQHIEGVHLTNMGQAGRLGRYPLHFHMSECVHGSTLAKNVIYKSNQRCAVIHGSHNVTVADNVAYDTKGHCFMLEDGGEWDNSFIGNLGALTKALPSCTPRCGETDARPSTFWITNPANHWIGNVAAGSRGMGFWFELKLRAPGSTLQINQGFSPKSQRLGTFDDNIAHSNRERAGITTYESGYKAPGGTKWHNIRVYKNRGSGLFQHGTSNIHMIGGLLADNSRNARNFHHDKAIYEGVDFIGRSQHAQSLIDEGRISSNCMIGPVTLQPNEGNRGGTTIINSTFSGYNNDGCTGNFDKAIVVENDQVRNAVFDSKHTLIGNTFADSDNRISACASINNSADGWVRYVTLEDADGSLSGVGPGFFVQDEAAVTNFVDRDQCIEFEGACLLFCPSECLRLGIVKISQDLTTRGWSMRIVDGEKSGTVDRLKIWFDELQSHLAAQMPVNLPAPTSGKYTISFYDSSGALSFPSFANIALEDAPSCGVGFDESQIEFVYPDPHESDRCDDLFKYDDYPNGIHGWQNFFAGIAVSQDASGSYMISTKRRKSDRGHVSLVRNLDTSCFAQLGGRTYSLTGKIRMVNADGSYEASDGTSNLSPKVSVNLSGLKTWSWNIATNADGTWTQFSKKIVLPDDSSAVKKALITIDKAEKKEFNIMDWELTLDASMSPTTGPTGSPTGSPSHSPSEKPTESLSPTIAATTLAPVTASPVEATPTNLALQGFASAQSTCYNGQPRNFIDGDANTSSHDCCWTSPWVMVDLGLDTVNYISKITIKNRHNCCGGRLREFHIEVLDTEKELVWSTYNGGRLGTAAVKSWEVDGGALGRFVRVRYNDGRKDCIHIAELEVWGYPVSLPAGVPNILELAEGQPASQSSTYHNNPANKAVDGNTNTITHTQGWGKPWWLVDLGLQNIDHGAPLPNVAMGKPATQSSTYNNKASDAADKVVDGIETTFSHTNCKKGFAQWWEVDLEEVHTIYNMKIVNRLDCCGGRLHDFNVYFLDENKNVVDSIFNKGGIGSRKSYDVEEVDARYVKIDLPDGDCLQLGEVEIYGHPSSQPFPEEAIDFLTVGEVFVQDVWITNRKDCCGGRLKNADLELLDKDMNVVDTRRLAGTVGNGHVVQTIFNENNSVGRYLRISMDRNDYLHIAEVQVFGYHVSNYVVEDYLQDTARE